MTDAGHGRPATAARVRRLEERVLAAGLASDAELNAILAELYERASPVNGARMVARAWTDPAYLRRLLGDGNAAAAELGFYIGTGTGPGSGHRLRVVANEPGRHNMIVCTLCSALARLVQEPRLPFQGGAGTARGACRVRAEFAGGDTDRRLGLKRRDTVHGAAAPPGWN